MSTPDEYSGIIHQIRSVDARLSDKKEEMKKMEVELKSVENEINLGKCKETRIQQDIAGSLNILNEKEIELTMKKKETQLWSEILAEKTKAKQNVEQDLGRIQSEVLNDRIHYSNMMREKMSNCFNFVSRSGPADEFLAAELENKRLENEIKEVQTEMDKLRAERQRTEAESIEKLRKQKEALMNSEDPNIIRMKNSIQKLEEEISERQRYEDRLRQAEDGDESDVASTVSKSSNSQSENSENVFVFKKPSGWTRRNN